MKKALSLILALILTFSMGTLAFAEEAVAITKEEAKAKAIAHVKYEQEIELPLLSSVVSDTYNDSIQGTVEIYKVTSNLLLYSGKTVTYTTYVDKYNGKIYYQKATIVDLPSIVELTEDQALSLALEALGVNKDNTSVLSRTATDGKAPYSFVFVEGYSEKYECTVKKADLLSVVVDDIKVSKYSEPDSGASGLSGIIERIVLAIKVLISKLNPENLLSKISAADLLKIFQSLTK